MKNQPQKNDASQKDRSNNDKGILLEQIVAMLHEEEGVQTETNVFLTPKSGDETRKREIDVLLTSNVAGYPVKVAIQCKNYRKPINVGQIGEFKDLLDDVSIPYQQGIIVSVNGFQKGAESRAKELGIKTFILEGLDATRLKAEIQDTFQFFVHLLLVVEEMHIECDIPESQYVIGFWDEHNKLCGFLPDLIVNSWRNGEIPTILGQYKIEMKIPEGWRQSYKNQNYYPNLIEAKVRVIGYLAEMKGKLKEFKLKETETNKIKKLHLEADFDVLNNVIESSRETPILTEDDLRGFKKSSKATIECRIRLPKIFYNKHLEPISLKLWKHLENEVSTLSPEDAENLPPPNFEDVEGDVFTAMTEKAAMGEPVFIPNDAGELIDVRLLARQGKFDEIINLDQYFTAFPREDFAGYLTEAFVIQCDVMLKKSGLEKVSAIRAIFETQAFIYGDKAISFSPNQIDTFYDLSLVFRENGLFEKSIEFANFVVANRPEDAMSRSSLAETLLKTGRSEEALEVVDAGIEIVNGIPLILPLIRAKIFESQRKYKEATDDLIKVWKIDYKTIVENTHWRKLVNDVYENFTVLGLAVIIADIYLFYALDLAEKDQLNQSQKYLDTSINLLEDIYAAGIEGQRDVFLDESFIPVLKRTESTVRKIDSFYSTSQWASTIQVIKSQIDLNPSMIQIEI